MSNFSDISEAIKTKLDDLKTANENIGVVYDYFESNPSAFPVVMFESEGIAPSLIASSDQNLRTYVFRIDISIEYENTGREQASKLLDDVADEVIQCFDDDITLGGIVNMVEAVETQKSTVDSGNGQKIVFTILLNCQKLVAVTTNC
ncbi:hypothetical protein KAR91_86665 [Candidatus Pacearchaeota archaeon]|nr:hypothetical protein [Candidatus Pacearchaeota archaeon]